MEPIGFEPIANWFWPSHHAKTNVAIQFPLYESGHSVPIVRKSLLIPHFLILKMETRNKKGQTLLWNVWVASWNIKKLRVLPRGMDVILFRYWGFFVLFCLEWEILLWLIGANARYNLETGTAWVVIWNLRIMRESLGGKGAPMFRYGFFFFQHQTSDIESDA